MSSPLRATIVPTTLPFSPGVYATFGRYTVELDTGIAVAAGVAGVSCACSGTVSAKAATNAPPRQKIVASALRRLASSSMMFVMAVASTPLGCRQHGDLARRSSCLVQRRVAFLL